MLASIPSGNRPTYTVLSSTVLGHCLAFELPFDLLPDSFHNLMTTSVFPEVYCLPERGRRLLNR